MSKEYEFEYEIGSGNVFADLGLDNAGELLIRAELGLEVRRTLQEQKIDQIEDVQELLGISQREAWTLLHDQYLDFTQEQLMSFLALVRSQGNHRNRPADS